MSESESKAVEAVQSADERIKELEAQLASAHHNISVLEFYATELKSQRDDALDRAAKMIANMQAGAVRNGH